MRRAAAAVLAALVAVTAAGAATGAEPGVTPTKVVLGGTVPLSGEATAFGSVGPGALAYFKYVNARGGVNGRTIDYRFEDDGYDPQRTVQLTRKLVEQDKVFAIFNTVGADTNAAIQPYLNARKVPQLFVGDGSDRIAQPRRYPWTMGFLQSYRGEGAIYGRDLAKRRPGAKVAVLYENTAFGRDMLKGFDSATKTRGARASYELTDTDVSSQIAQLKGSGGDTLLLFATPKFAIQAFTVAHKLGWKPQVYVASISIDPTIMQIAKLNAPELTKGAFSIAFVKNPNDPIWAKDPALALYKRIMRAHYPGGRVSDVYNWYGMTVAWTMVETLRKAGRTLTRAGLLRAAQSLDRGDNPFLLPGIRIRTSRAAYFPLERVYLYRYDNTEWIRASDLLPARS
jgi:branched-chain amino acid transport system substrate-binding protein